jgi:uncharacterized protein YigA (DUF484 family)
MSRKRSAPDTARGTAPAGLSPSAVRHFLRQNPEFLIDNPDLLEVLTPPARHEGSNVTDMGHFMVRRLQEEHQRIKQREASLLEVSRHNQAVQGRVHRAVLAMLDATSFQHLIHIVTRDLADILDVDVVTLCVEARDGEEPRRTPATGVFMLEAGTIDSLMGSDELYIGPGFGGQDVLFGPAAGLVRSMALIRMSASSRSPVGLMALGARDGGKFESGQASELLTFQARFLERLLRAWLDLPA